MSPASLGTSKSRCAASQMRPQAKARNKMPRTRTKPSQRALVRLSSSASGEKGGTRKKKRGLAGAVWFVFVFFVVFLRVLLCSLAWWLQREPTRKPASSCLEGVSVRNPSRGVGNEPARGTLQGKPQLDCSVRGHSPSNQAGDLRSHANTPHHHFAPNRVGVIIILCKAPLPAVMLSSVWISGTKHAVQIGLFQCIKLRIPLPRNCLHFCQLYS